MPADETASLVGAVISTQEREGALILPERYRALAARSSSLSFCPGWEIIEMLLKDEQDALRCIGMVRRGEQMIMFNGSSDPIHDLNLANRPEPHSDPERTIAYLRFYCAWITSDEGPFSLVESVDEATPPLLPTAPPEELSRLLQPIVVTDGGAAKLPVRIIEASMLCAGTPGRARFRVRATGTVTIIAEARLSATPVFAAWLIRAGARFLPKRR